MPHYSYPEIEGIVMIATRPRLSLMIKFFRFTCRNKRKSFYVIELDFKQYMKRVANSMNIGYHLADYDKAIYELSNENKNCGTFDTRLPGETERICRNHYHNK